MVVPLDADGAAPKLNPVDDILPVVVDDSTAPPKEKPALPIEPPNESAVFVEEAAGFVSVEVSG